MALSRAARVAGQQASNLSGSVVAKTGFWWAKKVGPTSTVQPSHCPAAIWVHFFSRGLVPILTPLEEDCRIFGKKVPGLLHFLEEDVRSRIKLSKCRSFQMLGVPAKQGADAAQVNQASPVMTYSNVFDNDMVSWQNNPNLLYILQILSNSSFLWMGFCFVFIYLICVIMCYVWEYLIWWYSVSPFSRCVPLNWFGWSEETLNLEEISELPPMFGREHRPVKSLQFHMNLDVIVHEFTFWLEMQTSSFSPQVREVKDLKFCSLPWTLLFEVAQTSVWCHTPDTPETPRSRSESVFGLQSWRHKKLPWKLLEFIRVLFPLRGCLRRFEGLHMFWKGSGLKLKIAAEWGERKAEGSRLLLYANRTFLIMM